MQSGFSEHITRYHNFFNRLAAPPSSLHITAFDQRGFGRTSQAPLTASAPDVIAWRKEGKTFKLEKDGKRKSGGWAKVMPDIEWFVRRESELAKSKGKKVFLEGFSMVSAPLDARYKSHRRSLIDSKVADIDFAGGCRGSRLCYETSSTSFSRNARIAVRHNRWRTTLPYYQQTSNSPGEPVCHFVVSLASLITALAEGRKPCRQSRPRQYGHPCTGGC